MPRTALATPPVSPPLGNTELAPWRPGAGDPWDRRKVAHLLRRAGYGATPEQLESLVKLDVDVVVEQLLRTDRAPLQESGTAMLGNGQALDLDNNTSHRRAQWIWECVHASDPLKEKLALFWHDHFSVGAENSTARQLMIRHVNIFRRHGLDSFRTLLLEVSRDPAMQLWLDNNLNGRRLKINENYSRELMELYTLGADSGYTQTDVVELAKCLSGWSYDSTTRAYLYRSNYHIGGAKTLLGQQIHRPQDGEQEGVDAIDVLLAQPQTARYVVGKIWRWFVAPGVDPATLDLLAAYWHNVGFDMTLLMRLIFKSRAFFSAASMRSLIKNPLEYVVGSIRTTNVQVGRYDRLATMVETMGLPLLDYPSPAGLPDGLAWINAQTLITRANFANEITRVGNGSLFAPFDPRRETTRLGLTDPQAIADHWVDLLADGGDSELIRWSADLFLNRDDGGPQRFVVDTTRGDQKVRGLVHALSALPEHQVN